MCRNSTNNKYSKDGSLTRALLDLNPKRSAGDQEVFEKRGDHSLEGMTPMHEPSMDDSPTWCPGEDEVAAFIPPPIPNDVNPPGDLRWLLDNRAKSLRVLVRQVSSAESLPWSPHAQEIREIRPDGQEVLIEYLGKSGWVKTQDVRTLRPRTREGEYGPMPLATCTDPQDRLFGKVWAVHRRHGLKIVLRQPGQTRITKKNPEHERYASDCVEVLR